MSLNEAFDLLEGGRPVVLPLTEEQEKEYAAIKVIIEKAETGKKSLTLASSNALVERIKAIGMGTSARGYHLHE